MRWSWINGVSAIKHKSSNFLPSLSCIKPFPAGNGLAESPNHALTDQSHPTKTCPAQKQPELKFLALKHLHPQVQARENISHHLHRNELYTWASLTEAPTHKQVREKWQFVGSCSTRHWSTRHRQRCIFMKQENLKCEIGLRIHSELCITESRQLSLLQR